MDDDKKKKRQDWTSRGRNTATSTAALISATLQKGIFFQNNA